MRNSHHHTVDVVTDEPKMYLMILELCKSSLEVVRFR
jgi:hypothetical protein